jgi:hypothetical protein
MAALTTQSQLTATTTAETQASVAAAINQLASNQQVMQQQFTAFTTQQNTTYQARTPAPHIRQFTIPNFAAFPSEGRGSGQCAGGRGCGGHSNFATTEGRNVCTPFANFTGGQSGLPPIGVWCEWRTWWWHGPICTANPSTQRGPHVLKHSQEICELECMFFVWF